MSPYDQVLKEIPYQNSFKLSMTNDCSPMLDSPLQRTEKFGNDSARGTDSENNFDTPNDTFSPTSWKTGKSTQHARALNNIQF